jgi:hypothetical protein
METAQQVASTDTVRWRSLDTEDAGAVYDLHVAAIARVGQPDLIRPETPEFFQRILAGGGRICGVYDADGLLAYGVLQWDLPPVEDLRPVFGLSADAPFAKLAGAAVRPEAWGRGLQESSIACRVQAAADAGLTHLYATSAPGNWRSWTNLLNQGFSVRALVEQYGSALRFILYRDLDATPSGATVGENGTWCDGSDTAAQERLLRAGHAGVAWRRIDEDRREILYRAMQ